MNIAFVENNGDSTLAKLIVIDIYGNSIADINVNPYSDAHTGMRFVEEVEWLTKDRIAFGGSINPSQSEYLIFDINTRKVVDQFYDDGSGASFSPDGLHVAYVIGSPHFSKADERTPTLMVDDKPVFSKNGINLEFDDRPQWSKNSQSVAILFHDPQTGKKSVAVSHNKSKASEIPLPVSAYTSPSIFWDDNLYVTSQTTDVQSSAGQLAQEKPNTKSKTWVLQESGTSGSWMPSDAQNVTGSPQ